MLGRRGMKLELAVADWKDKTDPRSGEDLFVAASAEDFIFREDNTVRARL